MITAHDRDFALSVKNQFGKHLHTTCSTWENGYYEIFSRYAVQKLILATFAMLC